MHVVFDKAIHLKCFLHFRGILILGYRIPKHQKIEFLRDVLGNPVELQTGIVDADSEEEFCVLVESQYGAKENCCTTTHHNSVWEAL